MKADVKSRELILNDLSSTLFVEAGAGSGKTTAMIARIMKIILHGLADVREIVAITFTNEGAASLKSKILQELERAGAERAYAPPGGTLEWLTDEQVARVHTALQYLPLAPFSTIHAFCFSMLKERPVEAGIDPACDINTEGNLISVFDEAWVAFLFRCAEERHPFMKLALECGVDLEEVREIARRRCEHPDLSLLTEKTDDVSDDLVARSFAEAAAIIRTMHEHLPLIEGDKASGAREKRLEFVRQAFQSACAAASLGERRAVLLSLAVYDSWSSRLGSFGKWAAELKVICARVRKQRADYLHHHITLLIEQFVSWFEGYKKSTSRLYFDDLLWLAREMLRTHPDVREYFKTRYRYLCIDEMQDTDPLQTEIVFFLAEELGQCADDWRKVKVAPSKLFLVGDPKQSIYKFRRADIAMYEEAKELLARQGGKVIHLDRNFRSAPPLIDFLNGHFAGAFEQYADERRQRLQPEYVPLVAAASHPTSFPHHIFAITTPDAGKTGSNAEFVRLECEKIIAVIRSLTAAGGPTINNPADGRARPVRFGDIMILMKNMTSVDMYERLFEEAAIPHVQVGGKTFFQTEDIRACAHALQAVDDPTDTVALFGALRSPLFGFSDRDIFEYVSGGRRLHLFAGAPEEGGGVSRVLHILRDLHYRREVYRPSGILKELFDVSGLCHVVMTEPNGMQKASRYFRLLELVAELEADPARSFRSVVDALQEVMNMDDPQLAHVTLVRDAEDAVRIMTVHKAKGLEAPVVILANGKIKPWTNPPDAFVLRSEGKIVIPFGKEGGFYSRDFEDLVRREADRERCEEERLRYVAATRARDMLVLCVPSAEEGLHTFTGHFAGSLILNERVHVVKAEPYDRQTGREGKAVDLQNIIDSATTLHTARLESLRTRVSAFRSPFVSVHAMLEVDEATFRIKRASRGTSYGIVLHRIMQHAVSDSSFRMESMIDQWMEEEGVPQRFRNDLLAECDALRGNAVVAEACSAVEQFTEWEFFLKEGDRILHGVVDLVYRNARGEWVIVDYKTDDISSAARKKQLEELYGRQVRQYARAFHAVTGHEVTKAVLLYTQAP